MRSKNNVFHREQLDIALQLSNLLDLQNKPIHILYNMDMDVQLKDNIMSLSTDIRKYYNCNNLKAVTEPQRIKRPWLSIIKRILKPYYHIRVEDYHFTDKNRNGNGNRYIHTQKYTFEKITLEETKDTDKHDIPDKKTS